jgi:hypothetical protein
MIVLDEQLLGRQLEVEIAKWYRGKVQFIHELRPHTVVKDDAIPALLRQQSQPTFVTINEKDFWRKVAITPHFCVVCFTLPDSRADEIPSLLRLLLQYPELKAKAKRMGKVIRVSEREVSYYTAEEREVKTTFQLPNLVMGRHRVG